MPNVLDLAGHHVQPRKKASTKGGEYHSACPGCGDGGKGRDSDRFHVWPQENQGEGSYWCRQCGKAGDGIQFLRDFEGVTFREACDRLGKKIDRPMPYRAPEVPPTRTPGQAPWIPPDPTPPPSRPWRDKAAALVDWAYNNLMQTDKNPVPGALECKKWLQARGINEFGIKHFRLGWNPGREGKDLFRHRNTWGLPPVLKDNGREKRLWIPRGLVIPLRFQDQIHRIRIRRQKDDPRYYVIPGSDMRCLITHPPKPERAFIIVESELDAILIDNEASDMVGAVALGNSSRKPDLTTWRTLQAAVVVLVCLDYDQAGEKARGWWSQNLRQAKPWPVPKGKDPGEAYQAGVDIREWVKAGLPEGWFL